jgi:hypothetical protein
MDGSLDDRLGGVIDRRKDGAQFTKRKCVGVMDSKSSTHDTLRSKIPFTHLLINFTVHKTFTC